MNKYHGFRRHLRYHLSADVALQNRLKWCQQVILVNSLQFLPENTKYLFLRQLLHCRP